MMVSTAIANHHDSPTSNFYRRTMDILEAAGVPFMVGGTFALTQYTELARDTKDVDLFLKPEDLDRARAALEAAGYGTALKFPHWLAKAFCGEDFVDLIYSSGNGIARVDDEWFEHAPEGEILGKRVKLCPVEETLWSKCFIMERERYDGADVAHLIRAAGRDLDWKRLLRRFDGHWRVLFSHLILFGYIYPAERSLVPDWVHFNLTRRMLSELETDPSEPLVCRGTFLSRAQYLTDIETWGYEDARLAPNGPMDPEHAQLWTAEGVEG